jgi:hypothetical protein
VDSKFAYVRAFESEFRPKEREAGVERTCTLQKTA